jgi:hypothetical protein
MKIMKMEMIYLKKLDLKQCKREKHYLKGEYDYDNNYIMKRMHNIYQIFEGKNIEN